MDHWDRTDHVAYPCQIPSGEKKTAVVFGPVAPEWTGGAFCAPLVAALNAAGYDVYVVDSIPILLAQPAGSVQGVLKDYKAFVTSSFGAPDIIAGYAYGGTLAMCLAPLFSHVPDVISVSGPGVPDAALRRQINLLVTALNAGRLTDALELLSHSVTAIGTQPTELHLDRFEGADGSHAMARMIAGFEFLLRLDVRAGLKTYQGRLIAMTGALSKLATRDTLGFTPRVHPRFYHAEIPNAGMRVLLEKPQACRQILNEWINHDQENSYFAG